MSGGHIGTAANSAAVVAGAAATATAVAVVSIADDDNNFDDMCISTISNCIRYCCFY